MRRNIGWICMIAFVITFVLFGLFFVNSDEGDILVCQNLYKMNHQEAKTLVEVLEENDFLEQQTKFGIKFD
ncbi:hypothetical protein KAI92_04495 [Candidatus Parcubacteria bacterium]|nr:hypothetical protein [Candidatus Parcubacteria bacterium]